MIENWHESETLIAVTNYIFINISVLWLCAHFSVCTKQNVDGVHVTCYIDSSCRELVVLMAIFVVVIPSDCWLGRMDFQISLFLFIWINQYKILENKILSLEVTGTEVLLLMYHCARYGDVKESEGALPQALALSGGQRVAPRLGCCTPKELAVAIESVGPEPVLAFTTRR